MKKTLIALAVLAASGASFAQVTITGNLTMGYQAASDSAKNDKSGFGVDTSEVGFAATEDLGGGMKIVAKMKLAGADRSGESGNGSVNGRDASLALYTTVGVLGLASVSSPDYLSGTLAGVDAYYSGWNGKVFSGRTNRDVISFTMPVGAFTLATSYQETSNAASQGLGCGTTGQSATVVATAAGVTPAVAGACGTGQSLITLGAGYAKGPAAANFTYLQFNSPIGGTKDQTRLSGNYDLGAVKLGAGVVVTNNAVAAGTNPKVTDMLVGVSVPMGALTFGLEFASRRFDDFGVAASGTITGSSLQAAYALSKRTSMIGNYARWDAAVGAANASTQYQLLLSHSF
jgi:predicted porin